LKLVPSDKKGQACICRNCLARETSGRDTP
jgi:hypothetical protein